MRVEIRNNSVHLDGYVNVHTRDSRVLPSPNGKFVEQIMPKAFDQALRKTQNVDLLFNHNEQRKLGSTSGGNLELFEDSIGLRAICDVSDPEVVSKAKAGALTGWSFGFIATEQRWSQAEGDLQRRYVDGLQLLEVSILDVTPAYISTTIEMRDQEEVIREQRFEEFEIRASDPDNDGDDDSDPNKDPDGDGSDSDNDGDSNNDNDNDGDGKPSNEKDETRVLTQGSISDAVLELQNYLSIKK